MHQSPHQQQEELHISISEKQKKNIACGQPKLGVKSIFENTVVLVEASISQTLLVQIV